MGVTEVVGRPAHMNFRRELPAPLTDLDDHIWGRVCFRFARAGKQGDTCIEDVAILADRRDADLMLALREARVLCDQQQVLHCILAGRHTALAGYDDPDISLVDLGLAMRIPKLPERYR